ncbi:MAG: hypothetical protein ACPHEP_03565 [Acidimicrobiales bacterium]
MALTPNVGGAPSAAKARELIMAGRVAEGMQMLKAASGQADTSIKSNDALQYMQKTGDQQGTNALLQASVGLPANTQSINYAQQVGTMPAMTQMTQKEAMDKLASGQAQYSTGTPSPQMQEAMSKYQQQMQQMAAQQQMQQQQMPYQQAQQVPSQQMPQTFAEQIMAGTTSQQVDPNSATVQGFLGMPSNAPSYAEIMMAAKQQQTQQPQPTQEAGQIAIRPGLGMGLSPSTTQQQQTPQTLAELQSKYQTMLPAKAIQQFQQQQQMPAYNDFGVPGGAASFYGTPQPQPTQMAQPLGGTSGGMSAPQTTSAMSQPTAASPGLSLMEIFQQNGAMRNNLLNSASGGLF